MNIELKSTCNVPQWDNIYLRDTDSAIKGFIKVSEILSGNLEDHYDEDLRMMGISLEESILITLQELLAEIDLSRLSSIILRGHYGPTLASSKYMTGLTALESYQKHIMARAECLQIIPLETLKSVGRRISYALGDIIYSFSCTIYDPVDAAWVLENSAEEITYSQELQRFFAEIKTTPQDYAKYLVELRHKYISVIPLFETSPELWEALMKDLPPSLVDTLTDYGVYITSLDVRAFKLQYLTIDENYLERLHSRAENENFIGNLDPDSWTAFLRLVPDKYIATILQYEDEITPDLLETPLGENQLTDDYMTFMLSKIRGEMNVTDFFANK